MEAGLRFYVEDIGFRITDALDLKSDSANAAARRGGERPSPLFYKPWLRPSCLPAEPSRDFAKHGRHPRKRGDREPTDLASRLLREVVDGHDFLKEQGVDVVRIGRDMPGGNWHVYFRDPDGHQNELYYGMEQVGWQRSSCPMDMYYRGCFKERPSLPQMSEAAEIEDAIAKGIDIYSGYSPSETHWIGGSTRGRVTSPAIQGYANWTRCHFR